MTEPQKKMWDVHTEMTLAQQEWSKAGVECREVAAKVLDIARRAGLERYAYHRPAHGAGVEGHQKPYVLVGDRTGMDEGFVFGSASVLDVLNGGEGHYES